MDRKCRRCMAPTESLSHVLGQCRSVKRLRIQRHNRIGQFLTRNCSKDWQILCEPRLQLDGRTYIPDLVFHGNGKAICVDVTVRFEQTSASLSKAFREKVEKYSILEDAIKARVGVDAVDFAAFVVGSRGMWTKLNDRVMKTLGLRKAVQNYACRTVLLCSLDMLSLHCRGAYLSTPEGKARRT